VPLRFTRTEVELFLAARVTVKPAKKRIALEVTKAGVVHGVRALEPLERLVKLPKKKQDEVLAKMGGEEPLQLDVCWKRAVA